MDVNLVVVDGSAVAQNAAHLAVQIARVTPQKISGVYVVDANLVLDPYASYQKELGRNDAPVSRTQLTEWFESVGSRALSELTLHCEQAHVPVETQLLFGGVSEIILKRAENAQMLTLGRRGREHATDPGALGANFPHIAHHARLPLLVGGEINRPIQNLLLLQDGSPHFDVALEWTVNMQRKLNAGVRVALMEPDDAKSPQAEIQAQLDQYGLTEAGINDFEPGDINGVLELAGQSGTDLILVGGYRHPEILEWLVGGSIDRILRESQLPVLIA